MIGEPIEFPRILIGNSPRMRQVHRQVEKLGKTRWPVLILGETGTGKEVVARSIHAVNPSGPFVTIARRAAVAWKDSTTLLTAAAKLPSAYDSRPGTLPFVLPDWALFVVPLAAVATCAAMIYVGIAWYAPRQILKEGLTANTTAAPTFGCAWGVARYGRRERSTVPEGRTGEAMSPLPVESLRISSGPEWA